MIEYKLPESRIVSFSEDILKKVEGIVNDVRNRGDMALIEYAEKFDGVKLTKESIKVNQQEVLEQAGKISDELRKSIDIIAEQLKEFHLSTMPPQMGGGKNGIEFGVLWKPVERVGIYVPGGKKLYPSTLLMAGIPALIAGVREIYVASPIKDKIDPVIAYIAVKLGIKEIYRIGGAQAISALAYGTENVKKVDKIVGPGNIYVQVAKYIVSKDVGVDGIEGPTELVIIADETANPRHVADDLMAQGEHGETSLLVLITTSEKMLKEVEKMLSLEKGKFYLILAKDIEEAIDYANRIAPEHLSLQIKSPRDILKNVKNAGAITLGSTPPALIDYSAGPDHILPTNGWSQFKGGLTVYDFLKPIMYAYSDSPSKELINAGITIAKYEGFEVHARSISDRYE